MNNNNTNNNNNSNSNHHTPGRCREVDRDIDPADSGMRCDKKNKKKKP